MVASTNRARSIRACASRSLVASLVFAGDRAAVRGALSGRRVVYVGGIAAATAAGAGAAVVLVVRGRRARLPLAG